MRLYAKGFFLAFFFHPDFTVGLGISPNLPHLRLVGFTTGRDLHPAPKIAIPYSIVFVFIIARYNKMSRPFPRIFLCRSSAIHGFLLFKMKIMCTIRKKFFCYTNCRLYRNKNEFYQTSTLKSNFASSFLYPVKFLPFKYLEKKTAYKNHSPLFPAS